MIQKGYSMGMIIKAHDFSLQKRAALFKPIIYCCVFDDLANNAISINTLLTKKLAAVPPKLRTMRLEQHFNEVLNTLPDEVVIKDFDVMFNPEYQVDLIRIMVVTCKRKPFSIIWPGKYENGKLYYAEEGYQDYTVFNIEDYDVTCIV